MSGRLIAVSNRLPYDLTQSTQRTGRRKVGGLVNALEVVLRQRQGLWFGWDGLVRPSAAAAEAVPEASLRRRTPEGVELAGIPLSEREVSGYYHGFCNRILWPLFHDFLSQAVFEPESYAHYDAVNRRFAARLLPRAGRGDRIWVHDLHLMRVPLLLREAGFGGRVDFFLHVPFPPVEIFRACPRRRRLLAGVLAADTAAFHLARYRDNFVAAAAQLLGAHVSGESAEGSVLVRHQEWSCEARVAPVGIDVADFERLAALRETLARASRVRAAHAPCRILFGADRLDYTKGIRERLLAFEQFLKARPEFLGRVVLIQFVVPSRNQVEEYRQMKREIDREAGRINADLGRDGWLPIHYRYAALERPELVAYYRAADVTLITPLRDGMNLVAAEFVASRLDGDGVLLLSEFAGCAEHFTGAVPMNPYDPDEAAEALARALSLPEEERRERMARLRAQVRANPLSLWAARCLDLASPREIFPDARAVRGQDGVLDAGSGPA